MHLIMYYMYEIGPAHITVCMHEVVASYRLSKKNMVQPQLEQPDQLH